MENFPKWVFDNYPLGQLQDMVTIVREMGKQGCTMEAFLEFADQHFADLRNGHYQRVVDLKQLAVDYRMGVRRCPQCGREMNLIPVNVSNCTQVSGGFKCAWQCANVMECGYEVYSLVDYEVEMRAYAAAFPEGPAREKMRRAARRLGPRDFNATQRRQPGARQGSPCEKRR